MRCIVVGLGVQGNKRGKVAAGEVVATVDPVNPEADYKSAYDVPLDRYDAVLACIPDQPKIELLTYFLSHGKHVLVEKPLHAETAEEIVALETLARQHKTICYTAYNHRFEPNIARMADLIRSGELGKVYSCRLFYGNGTARQVRDSVWRDQGSGVLSDLGCHLLDMLRYWFGERAALDFELVSAHRFENRAPDHVVIAAQSSDLRLEMEMTLLMWRNHFSCDILAEKGSAHIESLCKWGPATFTHRKRVLPSGRPSEHSVTLIEEDATWAQEYRHFKALIEAGAPTDLSNDLFLHRTLARLAAQVPA